MLWHAHGENWSVLKLAILPHAAKWLPEAGDWRPAKDKMRRRGVASWGQAEKSDLTIISIYVDLRYGRAHSTFETNPPSSRCSTHPSRAVASRIFTEPKHGHSFRDAIPHSHAAR